MKIAYSDKLRLSKENIVRLATINGIIDEYLDEGYVMTLRQLYYQLVSRDVIANNQKEYAKLSILLKKGRMAGVVDWNAIEDRGRQPKIPYYVSGIERAMQDTLDQYRLDRMEGQPYYIEVWIEKDALSNVFYRVTDEYHIRLMVNKGYSSCSAMHEAYLRFKYSRKPGKLLYFGDHDPSGKDMVRDIQSRLSEFGLRNFEVINPALSYEQVIEFDLPDNPAKLTDPRAIEYIKNFGTSSWELDALEPQTLVSITRKALSDMIDQDKYDLMIEKEEAHKQAIQEIIDKNK